MRLTPAERRERREARDSARASGMRLDTLVSFLLTPRRRAEMRIVEGLTAALEAARRTR